MWRLRQGRRNAGESAESLDEAVLKSAQQVTEAKTIKANIKGCAK